MKCENAHWHIDNHPLLGYTWEIQAKYGIVVIEEDELFNRPEFEWLLSHERKVAYAMDLGWRFNVDNQKWYRIRGF